MEFFVPFIIKKMFYFLYSFSATKENNDIYLRDTHYTMSSIFETHQSIPFSSAQANNPFG